MVTVNTSLSVMPQLRQSALVNWTPDSDTKAKEQSMHCLEWDNTTNAKHSHNFERNSTTQTEHIYQFERDTKAKAQRLHYLERGMKENTKCLQAGVEYTIQ